MSDSTNAFEGMTPNTGYGCQYTGTQQIQWDEKDLPLYRGSCDARNALPKLVVFISGPMTGKENFNRHSFFCAAQRLHGCGYNTLNPATLPDGLMHEQYMDITLAMLSHANAIYLLDGWHESKGARMELSHAYDLSLPVMFETPSVMQAYIAHRHEIEGNPIKKGDAHV